MSKRNLIGQKFARWLVIVEIEQHREPSGKSVRRYLCICDCGERRTVHQSSLTRGQSKSCGCLKSDKIVARLTKHGNTARGIVTKAYRAWIHMNDRCRNSNNTRFEKYGGRGISVCDRWQGKHGFENFLEDMGEAPEGMTLERENNNGNYEPGNCRWATYSEQNKNRRCEVLLWEGKEYPTLKQFAREFNIPYKKFHRLYRSEKMPIEQILSKEGIDVA